MTKDETLLVFTLVVSSVSVFLFGILLFMVLISATRDFRERTKSKLVKIMIWAGIVVITFANLLPLQLRFESIRSLSFCSKNE